VLNSREWFNRGRYRRYAEHNIFVLDEGRSVEGTILMMHGFPSASWDWSAIWEQLTPTFRCIAFDFLGFGFSDKPLGHNYSILEQADIAEWLVEQLGLTDFHVLSHDYGDTVAQELLARQNAGQGAGSWQSLCLLNGGLFPETHRALLTQKLLLSPVGPLLSRAMSKRRFSASLASTFGPDTWPGTEELDVFWALIQFNRGKRNFHRLIRYMQERKQHRNRWVGALRESQIPLALINGSVDPVSGRHMVDRYLDIVGEPDYLARLDQIGHYPQVEAPQAVLQHYLAFLKGLPGN
jgi:pimeloyl-ACP methyl ester carboxylesterase